MLTLLTLLHISSGLCRHDRRPIFSDYLHSYHALPVPFL